MRESRRLVNRRLKSELRVRLRYPTVAEALAAVGPVAARARIVTGVDEVIVVFTTLPDAGSAELLARTLVQSRTAACVNVLSGCRSTYRWHGALETAEEVPVMIKTTRGRYAALERELQAHHPYELPEVIAVPVTCGFEPYLGWVRTETTLP